MQIRHTMCMALMVNPVLCQVRSIKAGWPRVEQAIEALRLKAPVEHWYCGGMVCLAPGNLTGVWVHTQCFLCCLADHALHACLLRSLAAFLARGTVFVDRVFTAHQVDRCLHLCMCFSNT